MSFLPPISYFIFPVPYACPSLSFHLSKNVILQAVCVLILLIMALKGGVKCKTFVIHVIIAPNDLAWSRTSLYESHSDAIAAIFSENGNMIFVIVLINKFRLQNSLFVIFLI